MNHAILTLAFCSVASIQAATVDHTVPFSFSQTYGEVTGSQTVFSDSYLSASVPAFDSSLGTLESFSITWTLSGTFSGVLSTGGGVSSTYSGPFMIGGSTSAVAPAVGGGGNGNGGGPGTLIDLPLTSPTNPLSFTQTFFVAQAGTAYPQEILDSVTGPGPVLLNWSTGLTINGNWSSLAVNGSGSAVVAYNYIPETQSFILGIVGIGFSCLSRKRRK